MMAQTVLQEKETKTIAQAPTVQVPRCAHCGSTHVYGVTRVVGYFSRIDNWNNSKKAELRDRQKGIYAL